MTRSLLGSVALAAALAALPARAQMPGSDEVRSGLRVSWRAAGDSAWTHVPAPFANVATAGLADSGKALVGIGLDHGMAKLELAVLLDGKGWTDWMSHEGGEVRIDAGEGRIRGVRARADRGSIRYRVTFRDGADSGWKADGEDAGGAAAGEVESIAFEYRNVARPGYTFEFRVLFRKSGWTPWLKAGARADGKADDAEDVVLAYEIRGGEGIRYEATTVRHRSGSTKLPGQTAGSTDPADPLETIQLFGGKNPLKYRLRTIEQGWTPWCVDGSSCGDGGRGMRTVALQIGANLEGS